MRQPGQFRTIQLVREGIFILESLGNIGDFVGGLAVVVTLVSLAVQVRHNTPALRTASRQAIADAYREANRLFLSILAALSVVLVGALGALPTAAQVPLLPQEVQRVDVIALERDGRELFAFDALTGRQSRLRLELGEEVSFQQARGRIGLVLTDRRALAVAPGTDFQELRFRLDEAAPALGLLEDRIALVLTSRRALGFVGTGGIWIEEQIPANETVESLRVGAGVGVVTTNRRALGLSADRGTFVAEKLGVHETLESVAAQDSIVTLRTDRRILVFSAAQAVWSTQDRRLR